MDYVRSCAVLGCLDKTSKRHYFPNPRYDRERFTMWLVVNPELKNMDPKEVYTLKRICNKHFLPQHISRNGRLYKIAVPLVNLSSQWLLEHNYINVNVPGQEEQTSLQSRTTDIDVHQPQPSSSRIEPTVSITATIVPSTLQQSTTFMEVDELQPSTSAVTEIQKTTAEIENSALLGGLKKRKVISSLSMSKKLLHEFINIKKELARSKRQQCSLKQRLKLAKSVSNTTLFQNIHQWSPLVANFFVSQANNAKKLIHGRRFSLDDKVLALAVSRQSGKGYRYLSKLFALPSRKTLSSLLGKVALEPGVNSYIFEHLKKSVGKLAEKDKYCVLILDEMALHPSLLWNPSKDIVDGFEDYGYERTSKIADHALVIFLRGISKTWKQPVYYSFCEGTTSTALLAQLIVKTTQKVFEAGLKVLAIICDQGSTNVAAINRLVVQTKADYRRQKRNVPDCNIINIGGLEIVCLYDPPHLMKGIRNNFIDKNIVYINENKKTCKASWQHIIEAYKIDLPSGMIRLLPKLTDYHVILDSLKKKKMKVSLCTQVFSNRTASAIRRMSLDGSKSFDGKIQMKPEGVQTADLINFFDQLFDSVNGVSRYPKSGKQLQTAVSKTSPHMRFWLEAINKLENMYFFTNDGKKVKPPSLKNWVLTLKGFRILFDKIIRELGFQYFRPRVFNQDPLENFFGQMRQRGGRNINPTCSTFASYFKSLLVNNMVSIHSVNANCERDDTTEYLVTLKEFLTTVSEGETTENVPPIANISYRSIQSTSEAISFVSGFIIKKGMMSVGNCNECRESIITEQRESHHSFTELFEFSEQRKLQYRNNKFFGNMKSMYNLCMILLPDICFKKDIYKILYATISNEIRLEYLIKCGSHKEQLCAAIRKEFIKLIIFNYLKGASRFLTGKDTRETADTFFQKCRNKYLKSRQK